MKKSRCWFHPLLAGLIFALLLARPAESATITVKSNGDAGGSCPGATCTLRQAVSTAAAGDTVDFNVTGTITLSNFVLVIDKNLIISGPGANRLSVTGVFQIASGIVTISGLTIGSGVFGLSVQGGTLTMNDSTISGGTTAGGIITAAGTTLNMNRCTISGNHGSGEGGGVANRGTATLTNCTVSGNTVNKDGFSNGGTGGGVQSDGGSMTLINCTVTGNTAEVAGGGIQTSNGGTFQLINTIVSNNSSPSGPDCSGTFVSNGYNLIRINGGTGFTNNVKHDQVGTAGTPREPLLGPLQDNGGPNKTHALLSGSVAIEAGNSSASNTDQRGLARPVDSATIANIGDGSDIGAYEVQADALPGCSNLNTVVKNTNDSGADSLRDVIASVCAGSTITFAPNLGLIPLTSDELLLNKSVTITGPGASLLTVQRSAAGGTPNFRIFNIASNVIATISGLTIANGNVSSGLSAGGGIFNNGTLTVANATISGNSAALAGGGIANNAATLTLSGSTVSGNSAGGGAGISGGITNIINSTICGNTATGNGGGLTVGTLTLTNSTIAGNSAGGSGGGLFNNGANGATVTARSTIVALNAASSEPDISGALTSQGFNLIGNSSGAAISPAQFTDQVGAAGSPIDPLLGSLQDNGGPTFTQALLPGSPAIDKGDSGGLTTDQRGSSRPIDLAGIVNANGGDGSDIGAFEVNGGVLGNISTRLQVGTGNNVLFAGFIIQGTGSKTLLIRSAGPSLTQFGVPGVLANPQLELHDANNTIGTNDNWQTTQIGGVITSDQVAAIQNSGAAPGDPAEPAIIATIPAGSYTAIVQGVGGTQGVATVEVYDLIPNNGAVLANISTRGFIQTGDNVMIGGFIIVGTSSKVLVRATGPSLIPFGVNNALANPRLELHDGNGTLAGNDDWQTTQPGGIIGSDQSAAIQASGLAPGNAAESAIIATLAPGNYTAIAQGVNGGTGVGLVEVFALP
jgi:hypothetical protein